MKRNHVRVSLPRFAILLIAGVTLVPGQSGAPAGNRTSETPGRRITFGGRLGVLATDLMNTEKFRSSTSSPLVERTLDTQPSASSFGCGVTIEFVVSRRFALLADLLYRRAGYKAGFETVEGVDDEDTDEDERTRSEMLVQTRADYWELPLLGRFYDGNQRQPVRSFIESGMSVRRVRHIRTFREFTDVDGSIRDDESPVTPAKRTVAGIVLGGGFQLTGGTGVRITPEIRYTRWLGYTFDEAPTRSKRHQVELFLGITF